MTGRPVAMRRAGLAVALVLAVLSAMCILTALRPPVRAPATAPGTETAAPSPTLTPVPAATGVPADTPVPVHTPAPQPTITPPADPVPTPVPTASPVAEPATDPRLSADQVLILPWPLYEGDHISVDVDPDLAGQVPDDLLPETAVTIALDGSGPFTTTVTAQGLDGAPQARFNWVTEVPAIPADGLRADGGVTMSLTVTLLLPDAVTDTDPRNNTVVIPVWVGSREAMPPPEPAAQWAVTETTGVRLHYLTGSAAERDLALLLDEVRNAYAAITARLGGPQEQDPVDIYLLDRVIGQGGYASSDWVAVSYTDRRYAPVALDTVLRHELTHRLDGAIGCGRAPALLREGLAVYMAGGHYRSEPLRSKAAALLETAHYIPLEALAVNFYTHQHEVGYLEAGAFVAYVVETQGWEALIGICEAAVEGEDAARWGAVLSTLGVDSSAALEQSLWQWLRERDDEEVTGASDYDPALLELELRLMEAMRAYQASYDRGAHFLEGILFSPAEGKRLGIEADFVRRPRDPVSIGFELVLAMGQEAVEQRDGDRLALLLDDLEAALVQGPDASVFVRDAVEIAEVVLSRDWEPSRLLPMFDSPGAGEIPDRTARRYLVYALDRLAWPEQLFLSAQPARGAWELRAIPGASVVSSGDVRVTVGAWWVQRVTGTKMASAGLSPASDPVRMRQRSPVSSQ